MALTLNPEQVCSTLDNLKILAELTISKLTGRLYALKRLAGILELAGDALTLPNPASLIPYNLIDARAYEQLAQACPGLLPPIDPFNREVNKLRQAVQDGYANLEQQLEQHAYNKLAKLDSELSGMINQAAAALANNLSPQQLDKYDCLRAICNAATVIPQVPQDLLLGVQNAIASGQSSAITALTVTQQEKVAQFQALKTTVANLAASPTSAAATSAAQAVASPTITKYATPTVVSTGVVPTYRTSAGGGGGGAIPSVGLVMPSGFVVTGSPVIGSGIIQVALGVSGLLKSVSGVLLAAVPGIDYLAATGVLATLANLPDAAGVLANDGSGVLSWSAAGTGTVTQIATGSGLTGGPITGSGTLSVAGNLLTLFSLADGSGWLHNDGAGVLSWSTPGGGSGTVTNVATGTGLTGGPITTFGTISVAGNLLALFNLADAAGVLANDGAGNLSWTANGVTSVDSGSGLTGGPITTTGTLSVTGNLLTLFSLADSGGWLHNDGAGVLAWTSPSLDDLSDVVIASPAVSQVLGYNGVNWVNLPTPATPVTGPGVVFYFDSVAFATGGIQTLSTAPLGGIENIDTATVGTGASALLSAHVAPAAIGSTQLDPGEWLFNLWSAVTSLTGSSFVVASVLKRMVGAGTLTITGSGTSRTATITGGTPFLLADANADMKLSGWLETPTRTFQITAFSGTNAVTVEIPGAYTNEAGVSYAVHRWLFNTTTPDMTSTSVTEYNVETVQPAFTGINAATDRVSIFVFAYHPTSGNRTISFYHNGILHYSHVHTPLILQHNSLAGLQGGSADQYYHLNAADYGAISAINPTRLLGRYTGSVGGPEEISIGAGLNLSAGSLSATGLQALDWREIWLSE